MSFRIKHNVTIPNKENLPVLSNIKNITDPKLPSDNTEVNTISKGEASLNPPAPKKRIIATYNAYNAKGGDFYCCKFDPQDKLIAAASSLGQIHVFSARGITRASQADLIHILNRNSKDQDPITSLRWKPQSESASHNPILLTASASGSITQWDAYKGQKLNEIKENDNYNIFIDYNKDGSLFASGGIDKTIKIYDDITKQVTQELKSVIWFSPGHHNRIFSVKFHPEDPNIVISGGWNRDVYFWDLRIGRTFATLYGPSISSDTLDIKGNLLLTGSFRNYDQLELWDFGSRKKIQTIDWDFGYPKENAYVQACQFSKADNESIVAGCSRLNQVKIFDRNNEYKDYYKIENGRRAIYSVDFANNGNAFCFSDEGGSVKLVRILYDDYLY